MMEINCLMLGDYQVNCYVVRAAGCERCVVIDPGYEAQKILQFLKTEGLTLEAILLTHGHFDHVGAVEEVCKATNCALWMSDQAWSMKTNPFISWMYPLAGCDFTEVKCCREGDIICAAGLEFGVVETPGHTKGSVCYRCEDALFSGDTLFDGSCGRTDLPGGDFRTIEISLQRLKQIPENLRIFPGHGSSTTLDEQRRYNPYLR